MAPPKGLTGELAKAFREAFEAVEKRVVPLSEEGAKSLQRLSPEAQVAMDELLGGGAKLGEVTGTGAGIQGPVWPQYARKENLASYSESLNNQHNLREDRGGWGPYATTNTSTTPLPLRANVPEAWRPVMNELGMAQDRAAELAAARRGDIDPVLAGDRTAELAHGSTIPPAEGDFLNARTKAAREEGWPDAWKKWENIPGMALGAGLTGAALLARPAQAAESGLQGDDFTPDAPAQDDFEPLDDFTPLDDFELSPATNMPAPQVAQPERVPGQFAPYLPGVSAEPAPVETTWDGTPLTGMSVGTSTPAKQYGVMDALGETVEQTKKAVKAAWSPVQMAADKFVAPVLSLYQQQMKALYFSGSADDVMASFLAPATGGASAKAVADRQAGFGGWLRENSPDDALMLENLARVQLGPTEGNTPTAKGVPNPWVQKGFENIEKEFGSRGAAVVTGLAHIAPNVVIALIPGVGAPGTLTEAATAGAFSGVLDPESGSVAEQASMGLGGSLVLSKVVAPVASKGWKLLAKAITEGGSREARAAGFFPVAIVPPGSEDELADTVIRMAEADTPVIPSKEAPRVVEAGTRAEGRRAAGRPAQPAKPVRKEAPLLSVVDAHGDIHMLVQGDAGLKGKKLAKGAKPPKGVAIIPNAEARDLLEHEPGSDEAIQIVTKMAQDAGEAGRDLNELFNSDVVENLMLRPKPTFELGRNLLDDMPDWDKFHDMGDLKEGGVIVLEGGGGDGAARLYNVNDPKLQDLVLQRRNIVKFKQPDGTWQHGFFDETTGILFAPETDELIPNAVQKNVQLSDADIERALPLSRGERRDLLIRRQQLMEDRAAVMARQGADMRFAAAEAKLSSVGGGMPPPPPNIPNGGVPPPPPGPHNVDPTEGIAIKVADSLFANGVKAVRRGLLNPTVRGPIDLAQQSIQAHSIDTFKRLAPDIYKQLNKAVPELNKMPIHQQRLVHEDISRYLVGDIDLNQLRAAHPEVNAAAYKLMESHKLQIAANEAELQRLGMVSKDKPKAGADLGLEKEEDYAVRLYWRFLMKDGEWARLAKKDEQGYKALVEAIRQDVYSKKGLDHVEQVAQAERHLDLLLGDEKALENARLDPEGSWSRSVSEAGGSLKNRQVMAWWKKAALGEVDNAFVRIAESQARQKQLILQGQMWEQVAVNQKWSTASDNIAVANAMGHTKQVPLSPRYGQAAGRMVSPEVWEALVQAPQAQRNASTWVSKTLNGLKYGQTVGNPGSWVTNFLANAQGAMLSNLVNPFSSPYRIGKGFVLFAADHAAHKANAGLKGNVAAERFNRGMELGVVGSDYSTAEFNESLTVWKKALEQETKRNGGQVNWMQMSSRMMRDAAYASKEGLARHYGAIDSMWKYAAYTAGLEKFGVNLATGKLNVEKAIKELGPSLWQEIVQGMDKAWASSRYRPGMSEADLMKAVEAEVAQRIHYAFPMLDRVGAAPAAAGRWGGTVINPYLKIKMELIRNYAQLVPRIATEKGMAANLLGYSAVAGGAYFAVKKLREARGINQEEVDQSFAAAPQGVQQFKPGAMALWMKADNGRIRFVDLTSLFEPFSWMQGNPDAQMSTRMLTNMAMSPIDGSLIEAPLADMLAMGGVAMPGFKPRAPPEWQQSGAHLLGTAIMKYGPGILRNTYATAERGGDLGLAPKGIRGPREATAPQSRTVTNLNYLLGPNRFFEAGGSGEVGEAERNRAIQLKSFEISQLVQQMNALGAMNEGQSTGPGTMPLNKAEAMRKQREAIDAKVRELEQLQSKLGR